jgi:hypothetical protein
MKVQNAKTESSYLFEVGSGMNTEGQSANEHIEINIPIEVGGIDCMGIQFFDRTHTLMVSRTGGKISLERMVAPEQEVTIRCPATGLEADARVLGQTEKVGETYSYIVKFLDEKSHIWDITFPSSGDSGGAISCVLLECSGCKDHEAVYLDHFELELLEANGHLSRSCKRCRDASLWRKSQGPAPELEDAAPAPASSSFQDRRREPRRELRVTACVRTPRLGEDLVKTRTTSHTGLSFTSPWEYFPGEIIEIAVPYSPVGGNIFLAAKIVRLQFLASEGTRIYGVDFQLRK